MRRQILLVRSDEELPLAFCRSARFSLMSHSVSSVLVVMRAPFPICFMVKHLTKKGKSGWPTHGPSANWDEWHGMIQIFCTWWVHSLTVGSLLFLWSLHSLCFMAFCLYCCLFKTLDISVHLNEDVKDDPKQINISQRVLSCARTSRKWSAISRKAFSKVQNDFFLLFDYIGEIKHHLLLARPADHMDSVSWVHMQFLFISLFDKTAS